MQEMRLIYTSELGKLMEKNDKIVVLDADLARTFSTNMLYEKFPTRCIDVGIAESNMVSVAAGLASRGFIPFVHSFAPFAVRRAYDQIAVSCAYAGNKVVVVGADPGFAAALNGGTHMSFEDVAAMRAVPEMLVFDPADGAQLAQSLPQIVAHKGSVYLRLMRKPLAPVFDEATYKFNLYKADVVCAGSDITIVCAGLLTGDALAAVELLKAQNISAELICAATIKPLDDETIVKSAQKTKKVLVVENANRFGGLFGAVAETLALKQPTRCAYIAIEDRHGEVGTHDELKRLFGFTSADIAKRAASLLAEK